MTEQDCISFLKVAQLACAMASRPGDGAGANGDEEENRATADGGLGDEDERAARALQLDEEGDQDGARPGGEIGEWGAVSPLGPPPENVPCTRMYYMRAMVGARNSDVWSRTRTSNFLITNEPNPGHCTRAGLFLLPAAGFPMDVSAANAASITTSSAATTAASTPAAACGDVDSAQHGILVGLSEENRLLSQQLADHQAMLRTSTAMAITMSTATAATTTATTTTTPPPRPPPLPPPPPTQQHRPRPPQPWRMVAVVANRGHHGLHFHVVRVLERQLLLLP